MRMKKIVSTAVLSLIAMPAFAGGLTVLQPEPSAAYGAAASSAPLARNWSGFYAGAQIGYGTLGASVDLENIPGVDWAPKASLTDGDFAYGLHAGYNAQRGRFVYGAEFAVSSGNSRLGGSYEGVEGGAEMDRTSRIVGRVGYDLGDALVYATSGLARAKVSTFGLAGDESYTFDGYVLGVGIDFRVTDNVLLGAEYVHEQFTDFRDAYGFDGKFSTASLKLSYQF
ncbi:porin family protein [Paracoccus liaowanqingii]|uniref:Porin family protein n=2 Tax=Paracoccus liaowanqingii TaxID=2560053 RepID=A0A4Z1CG73_9RHOB|nr:porin family protein [Paracoccus liaowanqingii]